MAVELVTDLQGRALPAEKVAAFLADLNAVCRKHGIGFDCTGYECDGIELEFQEPRRDLVLSDTFTWATLERSG